MSNILEATNVTKRFGGLVAVNNLTYSIPREHRQHHWPQRRGARRRFSTASPDSARSMRVSFNFDGQSIKG